MEDAVLDRPVLSMARTSAYEQENAVPFTIQGLEDEYNKLDKEIKYSFPLDGAKLNELQARFAKIPTRHQAPEQIYLDRAADLAWSVRSREMQSVNKDEAPSVPPAFYFDGFVFIPNLSATIISVCTPSQSHCAIRMHLKGRCVN